MADYLTLATAGNDLLLFTTGEDKPYPSEPVAPDPVPDRPIPVEPVAPEPAEPLPVPIEPTAPQTIPGKGTPAINGFYESVLIDSVLVLIDSSLTERQDISNKEIDISMPVENLESDVFLSRWVYPARPIDLNDDETIVPVQVYGVRPAGQPGYVRLKFDDDRVRPGTGIRLSTGTDQGLSKGLGRVMGFNIYRPARPPTQAQLDAYDAAYTQWLLDVESANNPPAPPEQAQYEADYAQWLLDVAEATRTLRPPGQDQYDIDFAQWLIDVAAIYANRLRSSLTMISNSDALADRMRLSFSLREGACLYDLTAGFPSDRVRGIVNPQLVDALVRRHVNTLPFITGITRVEVVRDDVTRRLTIQVDADTSLGVPVSVYLNAPE